MYDFYIGVDLGLNGAIVVLDNSGKIFSKKIMPITKEKKTTYNLQDITNFLKTYTVYKSTIAIEKVHAMPSIGKCQHGSLASFSLGYASGIFKMFAEIYKMPLIEIPPLKWMNFMHSGLSKSIGTKERSLIIANKLFPNTDFRKSERSKNAHDGIIDALLIAEYARLKC